jgi:hypothetical protein
LKSANFRWIPALVAVVAFVPAAGRGSGREAAAVGSAVPPGQVEKGLPVKARSELRKIGSLIGRGEPREKYETPWLKVVSANKTMDLGRAIEAVLEEAKREAQRHVVAARDRARKIGSIRNDVGDELARSRSLAARWKETPPGQPVRKKVIKIERRAPEKTRILPGAAISSREDLDDYIRELEEKFGTLGDDAESANIDLQNALQKQQQLIQTLSNVSKVLSDTALATIRKIG